MIVVRSADCQVPRACTSLPIHVLFNSIPFYLMIVMRPTDYHVPLYPCTSIHIPTPSTSIPLYLMIVMGPADCQVTFDPCTSRPIHVLFSSIPPGSIPCDSDETCWVTRAYTSIPIHVMYTSIPFYLMIVMRPTDSQVPLYSCTQYQEYRGTHRHPGRGQTLEY